MGPERLVKQNLNYLLESNKMKQTELAKLTGFSAPQINKYLSDKGSMPSFLFLHEASKVFHFSLDDIITVDFRKKENLEMQDSEVVALSRYKHFIGHYLVYYHDTDNERELNRLRYGVISVMKSRSEVNLESLEVYGLFHLSKEEAEKLHGNLMEKEVAGSDIIIKKTYSDQSMVYEGTLELTSDHAFISMNGVNDKVNMIFMNPKNHRQYIGGLGTSNSISRGRHRKPCINLIILSRYPLAETSNRISSHLVAGETVVKVRSETNDLIEFTKNVYLDDRKFYITDADKFNMVEKRLEVIIKSYIEENKNSCVKVYDRDDDACYDMIKGNKQ